MTWSIQRRRNIKDGKRACQWFSNKTRSFLF